MGTVRRGAPSGPEALRKVQVAVDHGSIASNETAVATAAVTDAVTTDTAVASPDAAIKVGLVMGNCRVSAAGVVEITVANVTAAAVTTGTVTYNITLSRFTS